VEDSVGVSRYAADEIGLALRLSVGTASARLDQARRLAVELPDTLQAWEEGRLDRTKVRAVLDATESLDPPTAAAVAARVLPKAAEQTAGQLRAALARAVIAVDPEGASRRHEKARRGRRVGVDPDRDGMAWLRALLPAPDALASYEWLTRLARGMGAEDPRRMDERRADLLVALLTGRLTITPSTPADTPVPASAPAESADIDTADTADTDTVPASGSAADLPERATNTAPRPAAQQPLPSMPQPVNPGKPLVQVVVPLDTLTGACEQPGELVGYGPIPAELARRIAADGVWRRLVTDPLSGALLDYGRTTYRPPTALAEFVRARDVYCRHPGCRRRAIDSELDHTIAFSEGGETCECNLHGSCGRHHHCRHDAPGWTVTQHPDATITWTTPTGHRYTSSPFDYRGEDEPDHSAYILKESQRPSRPAPPSPLALSPSGDDDPPPF
jgi:hypothetical protein